MLTKRELNLFRKVTQIDAVSGSEQEVAKFVKNELEKFGYELVTDNLGSIFGVKKSKVSDAPRIMVASHMDEVGFSVKSITEKGIIKTSMRGGISLNTLFSQRVRLTLDNGEKLNGSIATLAPHLGSSAARTLDDVDFDFGFRNKDEALSAGVKVGQSIVIDGPFLVLNEGKRLLSKAFDNRYGVFMVLEMARYFAAIDLPYDLYLGATVQEEVGLRGAQTISHVINPDLAIVLDCSPARDTISNEEEGQLGGGLLIRYLDRSMIAFPELLAFQEEMARKSRVAYQYYSSPGGTDAGSFHLHADGVLTLTHCICARSLHTAATLLDSGDVRDAKKVLIKMLKTLNKQKIAEFKSFRR